MDEVVKIAKKRGTGARGLRSVLESVMLELMYSTPSRKDIVSCKITKDVILKKKSPAYKKKKQVVYKEPEIQDDAA